MKNVISYSLQHRIITRSPQETMEFGSHFSRGLAPSDVVALRGHLGSGKTTCIRGICAGLGVTEPITSPTFTLINEYSGKMPVFHFDFYRIHTPNDLRDLGLQEYFYGDGICLVEWPEVVEDVLPAGHYCIRLYHAGEINVAQYLRQNGVIASSVTRKRAADRTDSTGSAAGHDAMQLHEEALPQDVRLIEVLRHDRTRD